MARYALLIGNSRYPEDPGLDALRFPEHDVDALAAVLEAPERGGFEQVLTLKNAPHHQILRQVHQLLIEAGRDHLVLIYFSGHGLLDDAGQLYLAAADTARRWLATSAVAVNRIRELVDQTGNRQAVLILDCCHAGAVGQGFKGETTEVSLQHAAGVGEPPGRGMYILAASTAIQTAKEKETDANGLYTKHLIAGIRTGEADFNQDGWIGIDELHRYVREQVLAERPVQEPRLWGLNVGDPPTIAKSGREPRKAREQQIRQRLFDLAAHRYISDALLAQAMAIAGTSVDDLTPLERALDALLDCLTNDEITLAEFIRDWDRTNAEADAKSQNSPVPPTSERQQIPSPTKGDDAAKRPSEVRRRLVLLLVMSLSVMVLVTGGVWYLWYFHWQSETVPKGIRSSTPALQGQLQVNVNVDAAIVLIDGVEVGVARHVAPLFLQDIKVGQYRVRVEAVGYQPQERRVNIVANEQTQEGFVLRPRDPR